MSTEEVLTKRWVVGAQDRGLGRYNFAVILESDGLGGKPIVECPDQATAEHIVKTHNDSLPEPLQPVDGITHIDDWIDRVRLEEAERYPTFFFMLHRLDAVHKSMWEPWIKQYKLFCTWKGKRYRVTGCSRLGDVWLTPDFKQDCGYTERVDVAECSDWRDRS